MDENAVVTADELDGHNELFGWAYHTHEYTIGTERKSHTLVTIYIEDDENWFPKMTFDEQWLPCFLDAAQKLNDIW